MDADHEIDRYEQPAGPLARWFVQSEISLGVALAFLLAIVLAIAALWVLVSVVLAMIVE